MKSRLPQGVAVLLVLFSALSPAVTAVAEPQSEFDGWSWGPQLPERRTAFGCSATKDSIITVGGTFWTESDSGMPQKRWLRRVDRLKLGSDNWETLPDYPVLIDYALVVSLEGRVYAIGGQNNDGLLADTNWIAPDETPARWRQGPRLPRPMSRLRGGTWGNVIVALTDEYSTSDSDQSASGPSVIVWDTNEPNGQWAEVAAAPDPTIGFRAAAVAGERLFLFGGASASGNEQLRLSDKVWRYCLQRDEWRPCSPLPLAMRDATAVKIDERYIAIAGGVEEAVAATSTADRQPRIVLSTQCLIYDSMDDKFHRAEPLRLAIADHGMAVLGDRLLVVGGEDSPYRTRTDLVQSYEVRSLIKRAKRHCEPAGDDASFNNPPVVGPPAFADLQRKRGGLRNAEE